MPQKKPQTKVWTDVQAFFIELFEERPTLDLVRKGPQELISDMSARFKCAYRQEDIAAVLKDFEDEGAGVYLFWRDDFIKRKE